MLLTPVAVTQPGDVVEQHAQAAADRAVAAPSTSGRGRRSPHAVAPSLVWAALATEGRPLTASERAVAPGLDSSRVRVHAGDLASRSAHALAAGAYTFGDDIVVGQGYAPHTATGRRLIAHELAHVAQGSRVVARQPEEEEKPAHPSSPANGTGVSTKATDDRQVKPDPASQDQLRELDLAVHEPTASVDAHAVYRLGSPNPHFKDPTDLDFRLTGTWPYEHTRTQLPDGRIASHARRTDFLEFDGTAQLEGFDALRAEAVVRLRFNDPVINDAAHGTASAGTLAKDLAEKLARAIPRVDPVTVAGRIEAAFRRLLAGEMTLSAFAALVERAVRDAVPDGVDRSSVRRMVYRFLAEVGVEADAEGRVRAGGVTIGKGHASAVVTPDGPVIDYGAYGLLIAPPGQVTSTYAPALTALGGRYREQGFNHRWMVGVLQKLDTGALGQPGATFAQKFPTSGYAELVFSRRYVDQTELGIRVGLRLSSSDLSHPSSSPVGITATQAANEAYHNTFSPPTRNDQPVPLVELQPPLPDAIPYNVGITLVGTFQWLGGKGPGDR